MTESDKRRAKPQIRGPDGRAIITGSLTRATLMNSLNLLGLVSACTALIATIVGPLVALSVARRQFIATAVSGNRHKWIESLRDRLAELISLLAMALVVKSKWKDRWESGRGPLSDPALLDKYEHIVLAQSQIQLLINPGDADHRQLAEAIDAATQRLRSEDAPDAEIEGDIQVIVKLGQAILKREWQRVKTGT
jgi:hypothetical protein